MKKSYLVDAMHSDMRLDKWIKAIIGKFPQSLIERNLRNGKIKINNKKNKSSYKVKKNDAIDFYDFSFTSFYFDHISIF